MLARNKDLWFFLLVLLLSSWHLDDSLGDNTASRVAMVSVIVQDGTLCIDRYEQLTKDKALVNGHYYSEKAPLPAFAVVPFYWMARTTGLMHDSTTGELPKGLVPLSGFLCGTLPFALLVLLAHRRISAQGRFPWPRTVAMVAFFGSFLFVQSGTSFGHLPAALCTVLAWSARERQRPMLSAAWISAAVLCEYSLIVFPVTWLLQDAIRSRWSVALRSCIGGLPGVLVLLVLNNAITGHPFTLPYSQVASYAEERGVLGIIAPSWSAMYGLLGGTYRGLFCYAPLTVLAVIGIARSYRNIKLWLFHPLVIPSLLLFVLISAHTMWWGGWAFGPRHITVIAALLLIAGLPKIPDAAWVRWTFGLLGTVGIALALAAKNTVWGAFPSDVPQPIGAILLPALRAGNWTVHQWPVTLGLSPAVASFTFLLIFGSALLFIIRLDRGRSNFADAPVPLP
jgi:hypothetical protein